MHKTKKKYNMQADDKKIKSTAKDTLILRLDLKSPENRRRYPPDNKTTISELTQTISAEYELVLPQHETQTTSTPIITTVPNVPPPPPFPPDGFLLKLSTVVKNDDDSCLPKVKNKYGAVSKTYKNKIKSIFNQMPNNQNNFNSAKVISNDMKIKKINEIIVYDKKEEDVADKGSLKESNNEKVGNCDKQVDSNSNFISYKISDIGTADTSIDNAKNRDQLPNGLDLTETIKNFTLPRIALHKTGTSTTNDDGFVDEFCSKSGGSVSIAPINGQPTVTHHRPHRLSTSHYSTEKSGSSGYYGSNLYSAGGSSVDEHIYSEPVINDVEVPNNDKKSSNVIFKKEQKSKTSSEKANVKQKSLAEVVVENPSKMEKCDKTKEVPNSIANRRKASLPRDGNIPRPVWPGDVDDSLTNINLDAFNLKASPGQGFNLLELQKRQSTVTTDSGKGSCDGTSDMDLVDYHQTRDILVNICGKLEDLLQQHRMTLASKDPFFDERTPETETDLEQNMKSLKNDLENYLTVMTEKTEQELRQFSDTMCKDSRIQTVTKAFDRSLRRKERVIAYSCFTSHIKSPVSRKPSIEKGDFILTCNDQINPFTATPCDTVIQVISSEASDSDSLKCDVTKMCNRHGGPMTQKKLGFSQMIHDSFTRANNAKYGDDRENMLNEWHRDKPSIWEMYYGTNRYSSKIEQAMIREYKYGKSCAMNVSYPSTRPESDFTLDMPRAEELREKMEKEKIFRSRCRLITYFLGLLIFLLTVMIVSLVLTGGKRMFGSMI